MWGVRTIQKLFLWRDHRPVAYLACLLALALFTQLVPGNATNALAYTNLSTTEVKTRVENGTAGTILDVREYVEYCTANGGHIPCALNYPWNTKYLQNHYPELDPDAAYIIVCASGNRSGQASAFLESQGFTNIYNMSGGMGSWQGETQTCDAECPALYFPHVDTHGLWKTEIAIINTGDQTITGTLRALNDEGRLVKITTVPVPAHGRRQIAVADEFTNHTDIGYIIFNADSAAVQGYTKFYQEGVYRAAIPAVKEVNASDIYIPHIDSGADWWTGISLVNTTLETKELTMTFSDGRTRDITLNANQHDAFSISELFDNQPQPGIESAVISNASGVIGLELFGSVGWGTQLEGILLTDKTASTRYYPHVDNNGWWTGIVAYNPSESEATITITPYSEQGSSLTALTRSIPGKGKYIGAVSDLDLDAQTAWFKIDSPQPLSGFELFGTADGNQLAAYAGGSGPAKAGVFANIEKNGWTGIAFVNTEGAKASVILTAYDDNGALVATEALSVGGFAKVVNNPELIFTQDIGNATHIAYTSDKNVVGFQLNGSSDGTMLDGLPALAGTN
jgi:rhodanese-related sulfurtransferase